MAKIVCVCHIALRAKIVIEAFGALPSYADDAVSLATVANDVRMLDTGSCIVEDQKVVGVLISDAVVAPRAMVPLDDDRLVRCFVRVIGNGSSVGRLSDLDNGAGMALASVLVGPLPVAATDHSETDFPHLGVLLAWRSVLREAVTRGETHRSPKTSPE